jgi:hypothetical protein
VSEDEEPDAPADDAETEPDADEQESDRGETPSAEAPPDADGEENEEPEDSETVEEEPDGSETPGGLDSVMEGSDSFPETEESDSFGGIEESDAFAGMDDGGATNGTSGNAGGAPGDADGTEPLFDDDAFSAESLGTVEADPDEASPFAELESGAGGAEDLDFDELFTEPDVGEIDESWVWDELGGRGEETPEGGEEHIVSTRAFCAQCEHVAEPPEVACTYEGSEIVESVDKDNVRVRNCPIVAQRRSLSDMD